MKIIHKQPVKGRFDLREFVKLEDVYNFGILPFEEEWSMACPNLERQEKLTFLTANSWGEVCHIEIEWTPVNEQIYARASLRISLQNENILTSIQEEIIPVSLLKSDPDLDKNGLRCFRIGSLMLEIRRPFNSIRLLYRGFVIDHSTKKNRFMKLNLFSTGITNVFDNLKSFDFKFLKKQIKNKELYCEDSFEQWIQMKGELELEFCDSKNVYFWGLMIKSLETEPMKLSHYLFWNTRGTGFHIVSIHDSRCDHVYGNINTGLSYLMPLQELPENFFKKEKFTINSPKAEKKYEFEFEDDYKKLNDDLIFCSIKLMKSKGICVQWNQNIRAFDPNVNQSFSIKRFLKPTFLNDDSYIVSLNESSAKNEEFTGGKGCSLAILKEFSNNSSPVFKVPEALIVTTKAYEAFLNQNPELKECINENLSKITHLSDDSLEKIKEHCKIIQSKIIKTPLNNEMKSILKKKFQQIFGNAGDDDSFAVRSSAVGEDSEDMSAAGQMATFLGVRRFESICQSIVSCWASQFSQVAVEYKRGYGQALNTNMAVVVQKMIDCDVAGVMFTCLPQTGNERFITITGNYGLGESVVSGCTDADTFIVTVDVDSEPRKVIEIDKINIGEKKMKVQLSSELISTVELNEEERNKQCLTQEQIVHLSNIGLAISRHYHSPRDIEFGFVNGEWYLLQARPITNLNNLTEWEILHELDTGHYSENDVLSKHSAAELFPGACSYLLYDFIQRSWGSLMNKSLIETMGLDEPFLSHYLNPVIHYAYNFVFLNSKSLMTTFGRSSSKTNKFQEGVNLIMRGFEDLDPKIIDEILELQPATNLSWKSKLSAAWNMQKNLFGSYKRNIRLAQKYADFKLSYDFEHSTSAELWQIILDNITITNEPMMNNFLSFQEPLLYSALLHYVIASNSGIQDKMEILDLCSRITSSADNVLSVKVPMILQKITTQIGDPNRFLLLNDQEAYEYLKETNEEFCNFLRDYGHRGLKEYDLATRTWDMDPATLILSIKSSLKLGGTLKESRDKSYDLSKYRFGWLTRKLMNSFIIPRLHRSIGNRELSKDTVVRVYHSFRKLLCAISEKLVLESKLPDSELLFYMTPLEIGRIVRRSDPKLVLLAKARQRLHPKKQSLCFEDDTFGYEISPINQEKNQILLDENANLSGMPISSGQVTARCCVAVTLEDARNIQKGDILVTHCTDIGWSPYFPALSGLITEIGGLISHGAVIAREYGLPCLVGVRNATVHFKSGDILQLDTGTGTVSKVIAENNN